MVADKGSVFLYTHWAGAELKQMLQAALRRRQRWDDNEYLARIIFCKMVEGSEASETGFGIGTFKHTDLQQAVYVVNPNDQTIQHGQHNWSFEDFIK